MLQKMVDIDTSTLCATDGLYSTTKVLPLGVMSDSRVVFGSKVSCWDSEL